MSFRWEDNDRALDVVSRNLEVACDSICLSSPYVRDYLLSLLWRLISTRLGLRFMDLTLFDVVSLLDRAANCNNQFTKYELLVSAGESVLCHTGAVWQTHITVPTVPPDDVLCRFGRTAYRKAGDLDIEAEDATPPFVLHEVADAFSECITGLRLAHFNLLAPDS